MTVSREAARTCAGARPARRAAARVAPALFAALAALAGCGERLRAPVEPPPAPPPAPPAVRAVSPAPRSTGVLYDEAIWIEFSLPVDAATLTPNNVYLKLDTARQPVTLSWDAARGRLALVPGVRLRLRRTYTVEITPRVRTASGAAVAPQGWFWQFTTNSLRRIARPRPADGVAGESPVTRLAWEATDAESGPVDYVAWIGPDSAAIAQRAVAPIAASRRATWFPRSPWPLGTRLYWTVSATHVETRERMDGPVWRFDTLPPDTPLDSIVVAPASWGYCQHSTGRSFCGSGQIVAGQSYTNAIRWRMPGGDALRLAAARVTFGTSTSQAPAAYRPALFATEGAWEGCSVTQNRPAHDPLLELASDGASLNTGAVTFRSTLFAAHLEASVRDAGVYGYTVRTSGPNVSLSLVTSPTQPNPVQGGLTLFVYRTGAP
uniref:SbsA Ig-like domain-containing protein n=1 Tax=Eiseniibacteriota bacterium TaxID=2212470 RepID=A0A832MJ69_UNCEI